jgi:hypothetical protein
VPSAPTVVNSGLKKAQRATLVHGRLALKRLQSVFEATAERAAEIVGTSQSPFLAARASAMRVQMLELLASAEVKARATTIRNRDELVDEIVRIHRDSVMRVAAAEGVSGAVVAQSFSNVPVRTLAVLASKGSNAANFRTLINRHMTDAAGSLDNIIAGGIGTGQSAKNMARDIASLIVGESIKPGAYDLDATDVSGLKSIWYDSRRIAVSEINNAYRESNTQALQSSGIVDAAQWQLSGAHHIEDECDELAAGSSDDTLPPGYYYLDDWPEAPHPFCMCGQGDVLMKPVSEWFEDEVEA